LTPCLLRPYITKGEQTKQEVCPIESSGSSAAGKPLATLLTGLTLWLLPGCDAPRDNPFDPLSPYYKPPLPPSAITDLALDSLDGNRARLRWTTPVGAVEYRLLHAVASWDGSDRRTASLYGGELPGIRPAGTVATTWIDLPSGSARAWAIYSISPEGRESPLSNLLVIEPGVVDRGGTLISWANSIYWGSWTPPEVVELQLTALIEDPDLVDSVWAVIDSTHLGRLWIDQETLAWSLTLTEDQLPGGSLRRLVGHPVVVSYRDNAGFLRHDGPHSVMRVIEPPPEVIGPTNDDLVSNPPRMTWEPQWRDFDFTYAVEVVHVSSNLIYTLRYRREGISSDSTGHDIPVSLPDSPRYLYWTLAVVDEFGNRSVSREARFRVVP